MKKRIFAVLTIAVTLLLTGCSSDPTSVAKKLVAEQITNESGGALKLKEFTKTNATNGNIAGVQVCEIEYKVTIEAVRGGGWVYDWSQNELRSFKVLDQYDQYNSNHQLKEREVFKSAPFSWKIALKKTENGWVKEHE